MANPGYRKYRNTITVVDGIKFDSKKEAKRYQELTLLQKAGQIEQLVLQKEFPLKVGNYIIAKYRADFCYRDCRTNANVVEDSKGVRTPEYKLKKKLMLAIYDITILET